MRGLSRGPTSLTPFLVPVFLITVALTASTPPARAWQIPFDGGGSQPLLAGGVLYVGSADGALHAFDPASGRRLWQFQTGAGLSPGGEVIAVPAGATLEAQARAGVADATRRAQQGIRRIDMSPLLADGLVLVGAGDQRVYAVDAATGEARWSYLAGPGMASSNNTSYPVAAPLVADGRVYVVTDDGLHALALASGERQWLFETLREVPAEKLMKRTPSPPLSHRGNLYLTAWPFLGRGAARQSYVYAVAPDSGRAHWVSHLDGTDITPPLAAGDVILAATGAQLQAFNAADGSTRWQLASSQGGGSPRLLLAAGVVCYRNDRRLLGVAADTGAVLWQFDAARFSGELASDGQQLFTVSWQVSTFSNRSTLHALDPATGRQRWSQVLRGSLDQVLVQAGTIFLAGGRELYALEATSGRTLWSWRAPGGVASLSAADGRLFISTATVEYLGSNRVDQGYLVALDAASGRR